MHRRSVADETQTRTQNAQMTDLSRVVSVSWLRAAVPQQNNAYGPFGIGPKRRAVLGQSRRTKKQQIVPQNSVQRGSCDDCSRRILQQLAAADTHMLVNSIVDSGESTGSGAAAATTPLPLMQSTLLLHLRVLESVPLPVALRRWLMRRLKLGTKNRL
jgi:hypothetical protein